MINLLENKNGSLAVGIVIVPLTEWQEEIQRMVINRALANNQCVITALTEAGF